MDFTLLVGSFGNILVGGRQTLVRVSAPTYDLTCLSRSGGPDSDVVRGVTPQLTRPHGVRRSSLPSPLTGTDATFPAPHAQPGERVSC